MMHFLKVSGRFSHSPERRRSASPYEPIETHSISRDGLGSLKFRWRVVDLECSRAAMGGLGSCGATMGRAANCGLEQSA